MISNTIVLLTGREESALRTIIQSIVVPNLRLRPADEELFEVSLFTAGFTTQPMLRRDFGLSVRLLCVHACAWVLASGQLSGLHPA